MMVGERTNVIGSRKFKQLIEQDKFEEAAEIARRQVKGGAQVVDVNLQNPDRDELADVHRFYEKIIRQVKAPIMIDSTDAASIEIALTYCQGKSIVNSINLEDGEERFERVCPLIKKFGAAVVVGTIDEDPIQGMGVTRARKLEIARRSYPAAHREVRDRRRRHHLGSAGLSGGDRGHAVRGIARKKRSTRSRS